MNMIEAVMVITSAIFIATTFSIDLQLESRGVPLRVREIVVFTLVGLGIFILCLLWILLEIYE